MYCRKCGRQIADGSEFCRYCGVRVIEMEKPQEEKPKEDRPYWRNEAGEISCPGGSCQASCSEECPVYTNTMALEQISEGSYDGAIALYEKLLKSVSDFSDAWNNLAVCYGAVEEHRKAFECYLKAYELNPQRPNALFGMALAAKNLGNREECLSYCNQYAEKFDSSRVEPIRKYFVPDDECDDDLPF